MAFRRSDLQEAFFVPGTYEFRVWGYGTADPLEQVLAPGYFALARPLLRPGEVSYVSTAGHARGLGRGEARRTCRRPSGPTARSTGAGVRPPKRSRRVGSRRCAWRRRFNRPLITARLPATDPMMPSSSAGAIRF